MVLTKKWPNNNLKHLHVYIYSCSYSLPATNMMAFLTTKYISPCSYQSTWPQPDISPCFYQSTWPQPDISPWFYQSTWPPPDISSWSYRSTKPQTLTIVCLRSPCGWVGLNEPI